MSSSSLPVSSFWFPVAKTRFQVALRRMVVNAVYGWFRGYFRMHHPAIPLETIFPSATTLERERLMAVRRSGRWNDTAHFEREVGPAAQSYIYRDIPMELVSGRSCRYLSELWRELAESFQPAPLPCLFLPLVHRLAWDLAVRSHSVVSAFPVEKFEDYEVVAALVLGCLLTNDMLSDLELALRHQSSVCQRSACETHCRSA